MQHRETESTLRCSAQRSGKSGNPSHIHSGCFSGLERSGLGSDDAQHPLYSGYSGVCSRNEAPGEDDAESELHAAFQKPGFNDINLFTAVNHECL